MEANKLFSNIVKCTICILTLIFGYHNCISQDILWERSYGGKQSDYLMDVQPTADYGFILAGASLSLKSGNKESNNISDLDYYIWKMDENGDPEWQKTFGGDGPDILYSIKGTRDGGFILAGTSKSGKSYDKKDLCFGKEDIWIIKLNAKGYPEWQQTIGGASQDLVKSVVETIDGGFIIGGSSSSPISPKLLRNEPDAYGKSQASNGGLDFWVFKLDSDGKLLWQRSLGGQFTELLESIAATRDGGCIVGGFTNSPSSLDKSQESYGEGDYWVVKINKDGIVEWEKSYGGEGDDHLYCIIAYSDGGYIIGGSSNSQVSGNKKISNSKGSDFWVIKIDEVGEIIWQKTYNIGKIDILSSMIENADKTVLLAGYANSEVVGKEGKRDKKNINDYVAIKIDSEGEELWQEIVGSAGADHLRKVIESRDGGYILAGTSDGAISRDRNSGHGRDDFWVVKLKDRNKEKKQKRAQLEAIPNPSKQFTNVIVGFDFNNGTATLFDLGGRQLQSFEVSSRTIPIDLGSYPEGMYIVEVETDKGTDSVKIILSR